MLIKYKQKTFVILLYTILLRLFQQHYCYNVTGQSQESEGSYKPARITEVHSKLHSFQASLCTLYTHSYSFNTDIYLHIHSAECTVRLLNQAGRNNYPYNPKYVGNTGSRESSP